MNRIGSLCTGYGGLDMAVERVLGGETVWYSEFDKHPSTLLSARFPGIPNLGDLTKIDWHSVPAIDILTGGYPCQPFSAAGKRLGEDDPRHLWPYIREAIRGLRPRLTILENVAGHRRNGFGRVLGDCAEDGLHVRWVSVRASDVGAPHKRERLFFAVSHAEGLGRPSPRWETEVAGACSDGRAATASVPERVRCGGVEGTEGWPGDESPGRASERGEAAAYPKPHGCQPGSRGNCGGGPRERESSASRPARSCDQDVAWGDYEPAVRRWEQVSRPAPAPTEPNKNGRPRLVAAFDEWMMGLPEGWVTDIDIPYGAQIKLCGNGVVPQQAELAIRMLLT